MNLNFDSMRLFLCFLIFMATLNLWGQSAMFPQPRGYVCHQTLSSLTIDGRASESSWQQASFTDLFVDIQGDQKPAPYLNTRVKMLWDSSYLYFYAEMEEPHLSAKITERDAVIFHDNDFEIFIDPNGDTHNYYEFEINALNTVWDLLLTRPYRDGGRPLSGWDFKGLKTAVHLNGTLNDPSDTDQGWSVEIAIPWKALKDGERKKRPPVEGEQWRINFSRVQWEMEVKNSEYFKKKNADTGRNLPENNWVWSPQRAVAMHEPEFWGIVEFTASIQPSDRQIVLSEQRQQIRMILYQVHRAQRAYQRKNGKYADELKNLPGVPPKYANGQSINLILDDFPYGQRYQATIVIQDDNQTLRWHINEQGRLWKARF